MIPLLVLKFWSCQGAEQVAVQEKQAPVETIVVKEMLVKEPVPVEPVHFTVSISGEANHSSIGSSYAQINRGRSFPVKIARKGEADFHFNIVRSGAAYIVEIERDGFVLSRAKTISSFEIPLVCGSLAREYIPDSYKNDSSK